MSQAAPQTAAPKTRTIKIKAVDDWLPEQMELIGRIIAAFSHLEKGLHNTPKRMLGVKWGEYMWDTDHSVDRRIKGIRKLAGHLLSPEQCASLGALLDRAKKANEKRNALVHATWGEVDSKRVAWFRGKPVNIVPKRLKSVLVYVQAASAELGAVWKTWPKPTQAQLAAVPKIEKLVAGFAPAP